MDFGELLKKLRDEKGLSQEDLGLEIGTNQKAIYMMETGQRDPRISEVETLLGYFGWEITYQKKDESLADKLERDIEDWKQWLLEKSMVEGKVTYDDMSLVLNSLIKTIKEQQA